MATTTDVSLDEIRARLRSIGQHHVLHFHDDLDDEQRRVLLGQLACLDCEALPALIEDYVRCPGSFETPHDLEPAPYYPAVSLAGEASWDVAGFRAAGEALLRAGRVAAFTVAGGQGTRLGFDGPKGTFPGGAVTGRPLFDCLAAWIRAGRARYGAAIPWYIMTSPLNHEATMAFFERHDHFGLPAGDVMFFQQGVMPSLALLSQTTTRLGVFDEARTSPQAPLSRITRAPLTVTTRSMARPAMVPP